QVPVDRPVVAVDQCDELVAGGVPVVGVCLPQDGPQGGDLTEALGCVLVGHGRTPGALVGPGTILRVRVVARQDIISTRRQVDGTSRGRIRASARRSRPLNNAVCEFIMPVGGLFG